MSPRLWPTLVLTSLGISFGIIPIIVREVGLSSEQLVATRIWLSALFFFGLMFLRGKGELPATSRGRILASGLLLPVHWFTFFRAIETTRVLVALVLVFVAAPAMTIAATKVLNETLRPVTGLAVLGGFIGAAIAVDPSNGATTEGVLWALLSGALLASMLLTVKPGAADLGGLRFGAWQALVAAAVTLPWAISAVPNVGRDLPLVLFLCVGLTGISGLIYLSAMHRIPVSQLSSIMYLEPMAAVVAAAVILDENPGLRGWVGVLLVIFFGLVVAWSNERAARISAGVG